MVNNYQSNSKIRCKYDIIQMKIAVDSFIRNNYGNKEYTLKTLELDYL